MKEKTSEIILLKETQEKLLSSELRYRRLFESAKDGILIIDEKTGLIIDVNPFMVELLDYTYEHFIGRSLSDIGFFKDIHANKEHFLKLKEKKYIRYDDLPLETAKGKKIDVEFVSNVYQEGNQSVIQCNIRDITERIRIAYSLAVEHERLAVTLRSIGDGVITTDIQGNINIMNKVAEQLCGMKEEEAHGKPLDSVFNIINEYTRLPHKNPVEIVLKSGETIDLANNTVIISKDGTERIISDSAAPIKDVNNKIIGVVLVFRDITEKQGLIETSQRNQKLESLGVFAGGIAHDFNNLMGGIFGYIDLAIIEDNANSKIKEYLTKAMNTIDRARSLTQQLLTFSKGGAPKQKLMPLFPIIQETVQFALSGSNVSCKYNIDQNLWPCIIDKSQICQVIDNMIINAKQSMPYGGTIEISAENISIGYNEHSSLNKNNYVKISIKDSGSGIPKKTLSKIFDPFFTTKPKGHGLGLAISYSIINRHGGAIDVKSRSGEGTIFNIYLPSSIEPVILNGLLKITREDTGRIVVMDDEKIMLETIGTMLEILGYQAICKKTGIETLDYFSEETNANREISGLILDLTIPGGIGGKDVVNEIRKINSEIPVFVTSGYSDDPVMVNPENYGFTASICKPFRKVDLEEMLDKYLEKKEISAAS